MKLISLKKNQFLESFFNTDIMSTEVIDIFRGQQMV